METKEKESTLQKNGIYFCNIKDKRIFYYCKGKKQQIKCKI